MRGETAQGPAGSVGPRGLQGWVSLESDKSQSETHPRCLALGPWEIRSQGGERGPCLRPQPQGGVPGGLAQSQPGFVALGMAGGRSRRLLVHLEGGRVPAREPGWGAVKDVLWPSCVTRELCGDRQPGPLAHKGGPNTTIRSLDTIPSSPFLWPGGQPHPAG